MDVPNNINTKTVYSLLKNLPYISTLVETYNATIYGGILREIARLIIEKGEDAVTFEDIQEYLDNDGDVDMKIKTIPHAGIFARNLVDYLLEEKCHIEYMGYHYDSLGSSFKINNNYAYHSNYNDETLLAGTYSIWIPRTENNRTKNNITENNITENNKYYRYELTILNSSWSGYFSDFSVNQLVLGNVYNYETKKREVKLYNNRSSMNKILKDISKLNLNILGGDYKILYRVKKMWSKGYRPRNKYYTNNLRNRFSILMLNELNVESDYKDHKYAISDSLKSPSREYEEDTIRFTKYDYIQITKEFLLADSTIQEILQFLQLK